MSIYLFCFGTTTETIFCYNFVINSHCLPSYCQCFFVILVRNSVANGHSSILVEYSKVLQHTTVKIEVKWFVQEYFECAKVKRYFFSESPGSSRLCEYSESSVPYHSVWLRTFPFNLKISGDSLFNGDNPLANLSFMCCKYIVISWFMVFRVSLVDFFVFKS